MERDYEKVVDDIYGLERFQEEVSLEPVRRAMEEIGRPQEDFESVHVAGTNGKGSTATILSRVMEKYGVKTGLFTSPPLIDFRERMEIDGERISKGEVVSLYEEVSDLEVDLSFFEFITVMAFEHFSRQDVDVAVIETGMGGRRDATNVIDPELSVITNVSEEHTEWLGHTEEEIAQDVAGVIKEQTPVVTGAEGEAMEVIEDVAGRKEAPIYKVCGPLPKVPDTSLALTLEMDGGRVETGLVGRYQSENVATVLEALDVLDRDVSRVMVKEVLEQVRLEGRMELVSQEPLVLLDGAHNPAAVKKLPGTLEEVDGGETVAAVSIMRDKDYERMLSVIEEFADYIVLSEAEIERSERAEELESCIGSVGSTVTDSATDAVEIVEESLSPEDTAIFTGSLYFVGDVKEVLEDEHSFNSSRT
ncbi:MAG: bifunctional folylpolyglutamate synthase/dihydrofolate synthase [Candidatus Nanohaloarchaeota archaeon QJJ-7]|nr:bifunctional folylpolyglutamate synthase/dihydrofolate synthase [Candidatus Nanohaloarchaeota archaeon QJJ-7]